MSRVFKAFGVVLALALTAGSLTSATIAAETKLLRDIKPGSQGSAAKQLTQAGGMVFFTVASARAELWRTKGHRYDTRRLGNLDGSIEETRNAEGLFAYWLSHLSRSPDPWRTSDGTPRGTGEPANTDRVGFLLPEQRAFLGGASYFSGYRDDTNALMRSTDGTISNGVVVKRFARWTSVYHVTRVGNRIFFDAIDGTHGRELWVSDGTTAGTRMVKDIQPGSAGSKPEQLTAVGNRLFFSAAAGGKGRELWTSDGTRKGTRRVRDIRPGKASSYPAELTRVGKQLLFVANNGKNGKELWRSDGTWKGTKLVRDIRPGKASSGPSQLIAIGGRLYFTAFDRAHGKELWSSKGSAKTTRIVRDIVRGPKSSAPRGLSRTGNRLVFTAYHPRYGREPWVHKP